MNFKKLDYQEQQRVADTVIDEFMRMYDIDNDDEGRSGIIWMLQELGVELDACSHCGAMPMDTNCNNARCQDND